MNKNGIKSIAVTLATLEILTLASCNNHEDRIKKTTEILNDHDFDNTANIEFAINEKAEIETGGELINLDKYPYYDIVNKDMVVAGDTITYKKFKDHAYLEDKITAGTRVKALQDNGEYTIIMLEDKSVRYVKSTTLSHYVDLNTSNYEMINKPAVLKPTTIYNSYGINIGEMAYRDVTLLKRNNEYSMVRLDGLEYNNIVFVPSNNVYEKAELYNTDYYEDNCKMITTTKTNIYDNEGRIISNIEPCTHVNVLYKNNEYAYFKNEDNAGYISLNDLKIELDETNRYAYTKNDTNIYLDYNLSNVAYTLPQNSLVYVLESRDGVSYVYTLYSNVFMKSSDLELLDYKFIDIDLTDQRIDCYLNNELAGTWGTRSGKDSTPSHTGVYDIDYMAKDFEFTTFRGSYAKYWIPYSENGEGIHDLIGDDEENYGNEAYHTYGSHGCIRVPKDASEFVYNNYEPGDMVLVHK